MKKQRRQVSDGSEDDGSGSDQSDEVDVEEANSEATRQQPGYLLKTNSLLRRGAFVPLEGAENPYDPQVVRRNAADIVAYLRQEAVGTDGVPEAVPPPVFKASGVSFDQIQGLEDAEPQEDPFGDNEFAADRLYLYHSTEREEIRYDVPEPEHRVRNTSSQAQKRGRDSSTPSPIPGEHKKAKQPGARATVEDFTEWARPVRLLSKGIVHISVLPEIEHAMGKLEAHANDLTIEIAMESQVAKVVHRAAAAKNTTGVGPEELSLRQRARNLHETWHARFRSTGQLDVRGQD